MTDFTWHTTPLTTRPSEPTIDEIRLAIDKQLARCDRVGLTQADPVREMLQEIKRAASPPPPTARDVMAKTLASEPDEIRGVSPANLARIVMEDLARSGYTIVHNRGASD